MKIYFSLLIAIIAFNCGCVSNSDDHSIIGKWKMTYTYADIGDGKENWIEANNKQPRIIEFKRNREFEDSQNDKTGHYELVDSTHITILPDDKSAPYKLTIINLTRDSLLLRANCIEGCGEKYVRIK